PAPAAAPFTAATVGIGQSKMAGANLALATDVVIASEAAVFLQAFTRIGLIPDAGGTYWLPRQMGFAKAMGAALFAEKITAQQASDWGMIWEAVPEDMFEAHWQSRAAHLAAGPTVAYAGVKEALRASYGNDLETQLALEARIQGRSGKTRDFKEGVIAFMEKRPARYEGR
ncbi:MAG: enoyl-CoA hydratase-related protein, partial [Pseudomonadota bacterium]